MNEQKNDTITLTKAELNDIVAAQIKQFTSELLATKAPATDGAQWMEQLALTMAELTDQGTSRKRVAPEILAERAKASVRMVDLIKGAQMRVKEAGLSDDPDEAQRRGLVPEYQVRVQMFLDNQLIQPYYSGADKIARPTEIYWMGPPNDGMIPLNDLAHKIHEAYRESVGDKSKIDGKWADNGAGYWITAKNGLVIKGIGPVRQTVSGMESSVPHHLDRSPNANMLKVRAPIDPNASEVSILGTIAPPAKQTILGLR